MGCESANGRIKQWRALSNVLPNTKIRFAGDYARIVCSLSNAFRSPLVTSLESDAVMAKRMMTLAKSDNKLHQKVIENKWDKDAQFGRRWMPLKCQNIRR